MIDISGVDLVRFAQKVYQLSVPRGAGVLHFIPGHLPDEEARRLVQPDGPVALSMDYVRGRGCKMTVRRDGDRLMIGDTWYDHTDEEFAQLLAAFGITVPPTTDHGASCECRDCNAKRGRS